MAAQVAKARKKFFCIAGCILGSAIVATKIMAPRHSCLALFRLDRGYRASALVWCGDDLRTSDFLHGNDDEDRAQTQRIVICLQTTCGESFQTSHL